jgi:hypothetical protein
MENLILRKNMMMEPKKFKKLKNIEIIFINNVKQLKNVVVG